MRGLTPTKTNINFFVDPEEESRDNDSTTDRLGTKQSDLEGSANASAVVVRLMTLRENKCEASLARSQVHVSPA